VTAPLRVFESAEALGDYAAARIWERLEAAAAVRGAMTLGCPAGRSPATTYAALARLAYGRAIDGRMLHLVMMDEYVEEQDGAWRLCPADAHYSCRRFGETHIRIAFNQGLAQPIPPANLHTPSANAPEAYDATIAALGGIDLFLLASGAGDGHVAFNPPGTPRGAGSRHIRLADRTRQDNMATFPAFRSLDEVPRFGVSVGPATIAGQARAALMILSGAAKGPALARIAAADRYDPDWPATIVHDCRDAEILADEAAVRAASLS
jgi:glucosamine-6-phosphate deaminase